MPEQRHAEFYATQRIAMGFLASPQTLPNAQSLNGWRFCLRLWYYPSFEASHSWGIYKFHERGSRQVRTLVRQVTWNMRFDSRRFSDPIFGLEQGFHTQPAIDVRDHPIETAALDNRLATLSQISFPVFANTGLGIDGEIFGVALPEYGPSVEWWCQGPESWSKLTAWAADTREWLCGITIQPPKFELWAPPRPRLP